MISSSCSHHCQPFIWWVGNESPAEKKTTTSHNIHSIVVSKMICRAKVSEDFPVLECTSSLDGKFHGAYSFKGFPKQLAKEKEQFCFVYGRLGSLVCKQPETVQVITPVTWSVLPTLKQSQNAYLLLHTSYEFQDFVLNRSNASGGYQIYSPLNKWFFGSLDLMLTIAEILRPRQNIRLHVFFWHCVSWATTWSPRQSSVFSEALNRRPMSFILSYGWLDLYGLAKITFCNPHG